MPTHLGSAEIAVRLLCTLLAGALVGFDRGEHGRPAGLRTTMRVSMAASLSMIQANLLLPVAGKAGDSFVVMDLMRLPLGMLSGMGFIGAGAIVRRDNFVVGVTTAATLWFVTVIGLCFGRSNRPGSDGNGNRTDCIDWTEGGGKSNGAGSPSDFVDCIGLFGAGRERDSR
jgi:putative Mg2+ transporter-C (MgtC) family protein